MLPSLNACNNNTMRVHRVEFLSKFSPVPSPHVASFAAALVERMARRVLAFFVRHASLIRKISHAGKLQLAKVLHMIPFCF